MDSSQEAANQANIETARLTRRLVNIGIATFVVCLIAAFFAGWPIFLSSRPATWWLLVLYTLLVVGSLLLAISLIVATLRLRKDRRLEVSISSLEARLSRVSNDLTEEKTQHSNTRQRYAEALEEKEKFEAENLRQRDEMVLATPNKRLLAIAGKDAAEIQNAVIVMGVQFRNEVEFGNRYVEFVFVVFNQSVYEVRIDSKLGNGDIVFDNHPLVGVKRIENNRAQSLQPRNTGDFTVRQYLDSGDIAAIKEARDDRYFEFRDLWINVKGEGDSEKTVKEQRLKFEGTLSKEYPLWYNYNGPFRAVFDKSITGKISLVFFQHTFDMDNFSPDKDNQYDLYFVLYVFLANHSAPNSIERLDFVLKADGEVYEGRKLPLNGCRFIRTTGEMDLTKRDIENENDVMLTNTRRGWLQFVVSGVKRFEEDNPTLEIELDVTDKNEQVSRLTPLPMSQWIKNSKSAESYIDGPGIWQEG